MAEFDFKKAQEFLKNCGISDFDFVKIAGDMSFRSYYRVSLKEKDLVKKENSELDIYNFDDLSLVVEDQFKKGRNSLILMYAPPDLEDCEPFINIANFLVEIGLSAPRILAFRKEKGFLLLEDLGDKSFNKVLDHNKLKDLEERLYQRSIDCLIEVQRNDAPKNVKNYNHETLFREVKLFVDWYVKYEKKIDFTLEQEKKFKKLWFDLFDQLSNDRILVLRDYHADNLMVLDDREVFKKVGLLDFQDAVLGSRAYDMVSLLEDVRREVDSDVVEKMLRYYLDNVNIDKEAFKRDYEILSLQRNIKILGIISRVIRLYKKPKYDSLFPLTRKLILDRIKDKNNILKEISNFLEEFI